MDQDRLLVDTLTSWPVDKGGEAEARRPRGSVDQKRQSFQVAGGGPGWQVAGTKNSKGNRRPDES